MFEHLSLKNGISRLIKIEILELFAGILLRSPIQNIMQIIEIHTNVSLFINNRIDRGHSV